MGFFDVVGRLFIPRPTIKQLEYRINTAGLTIPAESLAGLMLLVVVLISTAFTIIVLNDAKLAQSIEKAIVFLSLPFILIQVLIFISAFIFSYLAILVVIASFLTLKADSRRNALEYNLSDFLLMVSSNMKAGMPLDQAMYYSAKPEFGLLSKEVKSIIKDAFSGTALETSLNTLASRFDSKIFSRTIILMRQASASGGEVSEVLERTSHDIRSNLLIKKDVAASLILYEIFILFAGVLGTPFLFAVSGKLVEIFEKSPLTTAGSIPSGGGAMFGQLSSLKFTGPVITSAEFFYFTIATIFITSLFSSLIVGVIRAGTKNQGIKYFPFVLLSAYLVFYIVNTLMGFVFTTISG